MDKSKAYDYNLLHASIKTRLRNAALALWYIAKATKLIKNKTKKHRNKILPIKKNRSNVATLAAMGHDNFFLIV